MDKALLTNIIGNSSLNTFLSDWNHDKSYEEIMETMNNIADWSDTEDIEIWEKFERSTPSEVASLITTHFDETRDLIKTTLEAVDGTTTVANMLELLKTL